MNPCIGIDVSKHHLDWVASGEGTVARVDNTLAAVRRLVATLRTLHPELVIVESTGGYERSLTEALLKADLPVALVNPWRVRRFAEGLGVLAKTDSLDARILALYGEKAQPPRRMLPTPKQRLLADLVQRRKQLILMIVAEKNRLDTAPAIVRSDIRSLITMIEKRVLKIDQRIDAAITDDPHTVETWERLQTVPSVGPGVARMLIAELPELGTLGRREIASLAGLAPFARDSGRKSGQRHIRAGRSGPRTALYLAAMNGARFNSVLKDFYSRLIAAGKPPKVALIALARKLLTILNAIVRNQTTWENVTV